jgi:endonuclease YncB( thermonuclease family)
MVWHDPLLLLAAALILLLWSTRRMGWIWRAGTWAAGAGLVAGAFCITRSAEITQPFQLREAIVGAATTWKNTVISDVAPETWADVSALLGPVSDVVAVLVAVLAVVTLVSLIPSDGVDKGMRPLKAGVAGAVLGGAFALMLVGLGLAGPFGARVYTARVAEADVIDGDTLRVGDATLRLAGLRAPAYRADTAPGALQQVCVSADGSRTSCGRAARDKLWALVRGRVVICKPPTTAGASDLPLAQCFVRNADGALQDVGAVLVAEGYAAATDAIARPYAGAFRQGCTLRPDVWRENDAARQAFLAPEMDAAQLDATTTMGCAPVRTAALVAP